MRLHGPPARLGCFKAGRKIRISGRLWTNSLGALAVAAKEGACIVRVPSLAAPSPIWLLATRRGCSPTRAGASSIAANVSTVAASPRIRAFVDCPSSVGAAANGPNQLINRIYIPFFNRAKWPWYTKPLINRVS